MFTIAVLGPRTSLAYQAAKTYNNDAQIACYPSAPALIQAFIRHKADYAVLPVYNTREGDNGQIFQLVERFNSGYWIDNIILYSDLSLGVFSPEQTHDAIKVLVGRREVLNQCRQYIDHALSFTDQIAVNDVEDLPAQYLQQGKTDTAFLETYEFLVHHRLHILEREVAPHNRTRFAVLGHELPPVTGYDATTLVTSPLDDRVGLLVDLLGEFTRRGINILDMRSDNDIKSQKLRIYLEAEGHISTQTMMDAVDHVETQVIHQAGTIQVLGSFPRVDMRTKHIQAIGFIGTGFMSKWFAERFHGEGYRILLTGRTTEVRPEKMINEVDVVVICVPISATVETIRKYGPLIPENKALLLLAGESEGTITAALEATAEGVEVMLIHNLWGPQTLTMKDKNAIVVRTARSGLLCSELEAFLYKHGAEIYHDSPTKHDLLMGVGQKLPTAISVALAMTLKENRITSEDINSHCTLTSLYQVLALARVHSQNPRTYAEIMSTEGDGRKIVDDFLKYLAMITDLANNTELDAIQQLIVENADYFEQHFLEDKMKQAKAVDEVLGRFI